MFYLFAGDIFYPNGGWGDFKGHFASFEEADAEGKRLIMKDNEQDYTMTECDWYEVIDSLEFKIVSKGGERLGG